MQSFAYHCTSCSSLLCVEVYTLNIVKVFVLTSLVVSGPFTHVGLIAGSSLTCFSAMCEMFTLDIDIDGPVMSDVSVTA